MLKKTKNESRKIAVNALYAYQEHTISEFPMNTKVRAPQAKIKNPIGILTVCGYPSPISLEACNSIIVNNGREETTINIQELSKTKIHNTGKYIESGKTRTEVTKMETALKVIHIWAQEDNPERNTRSKAMADIAKKALETLNS
jgi:hypothetical protein